jgi:hypothetical protein
MPMLSQQHIIYSEGTSADAHSGNCLLGLRMVFISTWVQMQGVKDCAQFFYFYFFFHDKYLSRCTFYCVYMNTYDTFLCIQRIHVILLFICRYFRKKTKHKKYFNPIVTPPCPKTRHRSSGLRMHQ